MRPIDSLYSMVQMPKVYPSQLTVAIGHATNAGLLAVRILSTSRHDWRQPMIQYPTENERNARDSECQIDTLR
jgi:phosphoribosylcarboxyaminoimidazole (NCAIR) mutase